MPEILSRSGLARKELHSLLKKYMKTISTLGEGNPWAGMLDIVKRDVKSNEPFKPIWGEDLSIYDVVTGDVAIVGAKYLSQDNPNHLHAVKVLDADVSDKKVWVTKGGKPFSLTTQDIIVLFPTENSFHKSMTREINTQQKNACALFGLCSRSKR